MTSSAGKKAREIVKRSLIRYLLTLLVLTAVAAAVHKLRPNEADPLAESTLALGFLLLFAFMLGQAAHRFNAPKITGFLVAGAIVGPFGMDFVTENAAAPLQLVNGIAMSLIAFTAGGELKISRFKPRLKSMGWAAIMQAGYTLGAVFILFLPIFYFTDMFENSLAIAFCAALLLGVVATANSPATAVAVITETGARGTVSDTVLGVTVFKDVIVVILFGLAMGVAGFVSGGADIKGFDLASAVFYKITASVFVGVIAGGVMTGYLKIAEKESGLFVAGVALALVEICFLLHIDILLVSITAGFVVENFSATGEKLIKGIEASSAPIFVVFFSLAGQGLDLAALAELWPMAVTLVFIRMAGIIKGTMAGLKKGGEPEYVGLYSWTGFMGQAGVSIGFAVTIAAQFPGWGQNLSALVMAGVVINQLAGPILMKRSLTLAGETATEPEPGA